MRFNQVNEKHAILVAEDEAEVRDYLEMALKCMGYGVETAPDGEAAVKAFRESPSSISAVVLDIIMPRKDGFEALREIRRIDRDIPIIMVSGFSSPQKVVEAVKLGATDFIGKPVNHDDLKNVLDSVDLGRRPLPPVHTALRPTPAGLAPVFYGTHPQMQQLETLIEQIGWSETPVLIQGETGSGKEVLARELHLKSRRSKKPFLKLNCAALPSELVESELFGYERGAFTGAFQKKPGMFEQADGGTILLDEIGDMDFKLQAKLLQVLQDHEFQRLGGKEMVRVDVRVLAATHCDLEKAIVEGKFREDLYYRLNVINLHVPPLRERKQDILPLAELLMRKHAGSDTPLPELGPSLIEAFDLYDWPGNIRELENIIRKLLVLRDSDVVARDLWARANRMKSLRSPDSLDLGALATGGDVLKRVDQAKQSAERTAILAALNSNRWNRRKTAAQLEIDYKALLYKMKKLHIDEQKDHREREALLTADVG